MEVFLQRNSSWLEQASELESEQPGIQIQLISKEGQTTSISSSLLLATSSFIKSMLSTSCCCTTSGISLPSISNSTLVLLAQILCKGETDHTDGLQTTMDSLKKVQIVMAMLGINVKVVPKLVIPVNETSSFVATTSDDQLLDFDNNINEDLDNNNTEDFDNSIEDGINKESLYDKNKKLDNSIDFLDENVENVTISDEPRKLQTGQKSKIWVKKSAKVSDKEAYSEILCRVCSLKFSSKSSFMSHHKQIHGKNSEELQYQCEDCMSRYRNLRNLERHRRLKHGYVAQARKTVRKTSKSTLVPTNHESTPDPNKVKIFDCSQCDRMFLHKSGLHKHVERIHKGVKYGCGVCSLITGYRTSMLKHCRKYGHDDNLIFKIL